MAGKRQVGRTPEQAEAMLRAVFDGHTPSEALVAGGLVPAGQRSAQQGIVERAMNQPSMVRMLVPALAEAGVNATSLAEAFWGGLNATMLVERRRWETDEETGKGRWVHIQEEVPDHRRRVETARIVTQLLQRDDELRQRQREHEDTRPVVPDVPLDLAPGDAIRELQRLMREGKGR